MYIHAERLLAKAGSQDARGGVSPTLEMQRSGMERGVAERRSAQAEGAEDWGIPLRCANGAAPLREVWLPICTRSVPYFRVGVAGGKGPLEGVAEERFTALQLGAGAPRQHVSA